MTLTEVLTALTAELEEAIDNYPHFNSGHEGYAIIKEELDELWDCVKMNQMHPNRGILMQREAIQVAAMAVRFILDFPHFKN